MGNTTIKLGPHAMSFYDPASGLSLAPGEEKELPKGRRSWVLREAIRGGGVILTKPEAPKPIPPKDEDPKGEDPKDEDPKGEDPKDLLLAMTRKEIMSKYSFIDEDHLEEASKKKTKEDLVDFLLSIEGEYE